MTAFALLLCIMLNISVMFCFKPITLSQNAIISTRQFTSGKLLERLTMGLIPRRHKKFFSKPFDEFIELVKTTKHKILRFPHPKLRQENLPVTKFDESLRILAGEMLLLMYTTDGVGLAAPQIGINLQLLVFNEEGTIDSRQKEEIICNPKIVNKSAQRVGGPEGCLSFPQIYGEVERHSWIEVEYQNLVGETRVKKFEGFPAIIFQHEFDHLNKVLLIDRLSFLDLNSNELRIARLIRRWESDNNQKFMIPIKPSPEKPVDGKALKTLFEKFQEPPPST